MAEKGKYWVAIGYPENMIDDWQNKIDDLLELPYAYCIHDKDKLLLDPEYEPEDGEHDERKDHVHIIIAFPNTTTYNHALKAFRRLNKPHCNAFNTCMQILNIRNKYEYLIHNTKKAKEDGKYQYDLSERITGNNFDIGAYEQLGLEEIEKIRRELSLICIDKCFVSYSAFYHFVLTTFDTQYESMVVRYQGHFDKLCKGNFHYQEKVKKLLEKEEQRRSKKND